MNQTRTACIVLKSSSLSPEELLQREVEWEAQLAREFWQMFMNGLNTEIAGKRQQAEAIRRMLGGKEKEP